MEYFIMKNKLLFYLLFIFAALFLFVSCWVNAREDSININVGPEPKTIDPTLNSAVDGSIYIQHAFEGLATRDKENNITGGVAESWDISEDGLTYVFHIREDAK